MEDQAMPEEQKPQELTAAESKKLAFEADPDNFEDLSTLAVCVKFIDGEWQTMVSPKLKIKDALFIKAALDHRLSGYINQRELQAMQSMQKIVKPNGGMMNGLRNKYFGKH